MKKSSKKKLLMLSLIAFTLPLTGCDNNVESAPNSSSSQTTSTSQEVKRRVILKRRRKSIL